MNRSYFLKRVRDSLFSGRLSQSQTDGLTRILDYRDEKWPNMPDDELAYLLATAKWETAHKMQPVTEMGSQSYLRGKAYWPWIGRGLVQITWKRNYEKYGITKPAQALEWPTALHVIFHGMIHGTFTGKKLSDYIGPGRRDYVGARRIINGTDKAKQIALIAEGFREALVQAREAGDVPEDEPQTTGKPITKSKTVAAEAGKWIVGGGLASLSWLSDVPWQTLAVIGVIGLAGLSLWTVYERWKKSVNEGV